MVDIAVYGFLIVGNRIFGGMPGIQHPTIWITDPGLVWHGQLQGLSIVFCL